MGLDAFVSCNCYRDGHTTPFPRPEAEAHFIFDEDGCWTLDEDHIPYIGNEDLYEAISNWRDFHACAHDGMAHVMLHVANELDYRSFLNILEQIGWQYFPTLREELPREGIERSTPASAALKALAELHDFSQRVKDCMVTYLVNTATQQRLYEYVAAFDGVFLRAGSPPGLEIGVDNDGFFIAECPPVDTFLPEAGRLSQRNRREFFRAQRFEQRLLESDRHGMPLRVEYFDADTEARFIGSVAVGVHTTGNDGRLQFSYPQIMHVERERVREDEFGHVVSALICLCEAAIETGNPIVWC